MAKLFSPVFYICGILAMIMSAMMMVPMSLAMFRDDPEFGDFLLSAIIAGSVGYMLFRAFKMQKIELHIRHLYLLTNCAWVLMSFVGALPFILSSHPMSVTDSVFEAVSGITTTGSTVMSNLQSTPPSVLIWRSMLQWLGGLGVIGMAVTILPFLRVGGMRLFRTESSDWSEKTLPRFRDFARLLLVTYLLISMACAFSYWLAGMTVFDAINHAMTTISTGGYATDDRSMGRFGNTILWISIFFMLLGAIPFILYVRLLTTRSTRNLWDSQVITFMTIVGVISASLTAHLVYSDQLELGDALTHSTFNLVSVITTTGYASSDYALWGHFSIAVFFLASFVGGCSGSTSGGMKVFRFQLSYLYLRDQLRRLVHPHGIFAIKYNGRLIQHDILAAAAAFSFVYLSSIALITLLLTVIGIDFITSLTGAMTALANVGPGLGELIGPSGNFQSLPDAGKWILAFAMILGRLEIFTVIILFAPVYWKA